MKRNKCQSKLHKEKHIEAIFFDHGHQEHWEASIRLISASVFHPRSSFVPLLSHGTTLCPLPDKQVFLLCIHFFFHLGSSCLPYIVPRKRRDNKSLRNMTLTASRSSFTLCQMR